ncbi:MAG: DUF2332 family protein [Cyanobacteriota bacterium]
MEKEFLIKNLLDQSETCGKTSDLYRDMLIIISKSENYLDLMIDIFNKRKFNGAIEICLLLASFFHNLALENKHNEIRGFFKTYSGNYDQTLFNQLKTTLEDIFKKYENEISDWLLEKKLQTNEVARSSVIYPLLLSLNLEKINLFEIGCSAGLLLFPDKYSYKYKKNNEFFEIKNVNLIIETEINDLEKLKNILKNQEKIQITKRIGFDLNPLDINNRENQNLLKSAIWDDKERELRLDKAINIFEKYKNEVYLESLDYTKNLAERISFLSTPDSEIVVFTSVSTYQVDKESHDKLILELEKTAKLTSKKVYFLQFEGKRKDQDLTIELTEEEPFYLSVTIFPEKKETFFAKAHFHGKKLSIL